MGHIFSGRKARKARRDSGVARGSAKRASRKQLDLKIFDTDDVRKWSQEDIADLRAMIRERGKDIATSISGGFGEQDATSFAVDHGIVNEDFSSYGYTEKEMREFSPQTLFRMFMEQNQYYEMISDIKEQKEFASENPSEPMSDVMKDNEKWRMLRRFAETDKRLNYDRVYASQTLKDIETWIAKNKYTYDQILEQLEKQHIKGEAENAKWNESIVPFEDRVIVANKGFHGEEKAKQAWEFNYKRAMKNLMSYAPQWQQPASYNGPIDWIEKE